MSSDGEQYFWGSHGINTGGGLANHAGVLEYQRKEREKNATPVVTTSPQRARNAAPVISTATGPNGVYARPDVPFEDWFSNLVSFVIFGSMTYYGIQNVAGEWYWIAGTALAVAVLVNKLLRGPLRFVMTGIKILLTIGFWGGLAGGVLYLLGAA